MPRLPATARPWSGLDWRWAARRAVVLFTASVLAVVCLVPAGGAQGMSASAARATNTRSALPTADPLNGGYLLLNMHGMLFHPLISDVAEDITYARWLGSGVIRV